MHYRLPSNPVMFALKPPADPHPPAESKSKKPLLRLLLGHVHTLWLLIAATSAWHLMFTTPNPFSHKYRSNKRPRYCLQDSPWRNIKPNSKLHWQPCYLKYQCAQLEVPLDYSNINGEKAGIALYKLPASVSPEDKEYRGPILINPGGPGNPPFSMLQSMGGRIQSIVGSEFDIIAFDPRGIGETIPDIYGFEDSAERETWSLLEPPLINATSDALSKRISRAHVLNNLIKQKSGHVAEHVNSANVARDMWEIVKAHGLRELQYWGQSYGAILGLTYATLFPQHVGPMVLDGTPDIDDYYTTKWASNLADTSKTLNAFYDGCVAAGPTRCAFYSNTSAMIKYRLDNLYTRVQKHPVPGFESGSGIYGVVDYSTLQQALHDSIYRPYEEFSGLALALAELEAGNGTRILSRTRSQRSWCPRCGDKPRWGGYRVESRVVTMCNDGKSVTDSEEELLAHYMALAKDSSFADIWASFRVLCSGWDIRPKSVVTGPFTANASFPLLFVSNTVDPVSPLRNVEKMTRSYAPSALLVQRAFGHCSTAARSNCTNTVIRKYFRDRELSVPPEPCDIENDLFEESAMMQRN